MKEINTKYKRSPWSLVLGVFALSLAACGGDSSTSSTGSSECTNTYGINTVTDCRDGQTYATVVIGTQTWMAQNLNYAVDSSWCYDNSADSCAKYGRLYQWTAAMDVDVNYNYAVFGDSVNHQGACPKGWHVPRSSEWETLETFVGGEDIAGTVLKSTSGWDDENGNGTDAYGFSALPAGSRYNFGGGYFDDASHNASFWSATIEDYGLYHGHLAAYERQLLCNYAGIITDEDSTRNAHSVRCIKN